MDMSPAFVGVCRRGLVGIGGCGVGVGRGVGFGAETGV